MNRYKEFGLKLKELRDKKGESVTNVAKAVGVDRTHLSKLENGHERPSPQVLNTLISHYSLSREKAIELSNLAGFVGKELVVTEEGKGVIKLDDVQLPKPGTPKEVQVNLSNNTPVLYTDSVFITSNQYGLVLDFAQSMGPTNQQNIVARLGMSKDHAKSMLKVLQENLKNQEER